MLNSVSAKAEFHLCHINKSATVEIYLYIYIWSKDDVFIPRHWNNYTIAVLVSARQVEYKWNQARQCNWSILCFSCQIGFIKVGKCLTVQKSFKTWWLGTIVASENSETKNRRPGWGSNPQHSDPQSENLPLSRCRLIWETILKLHLNSWLMKKTSLVEFCNWKR